MLGQTAGDPQALLYFEAYLQLDVVARWRAARKGQDQMVGQPG